MINEAKGNMYSWVTHTWNTIKGECPHGCTYCYMHRWGKQKPVRFDKKELNTDLGSGNFIFVGSSCDIFAREIPDHWIVETLEHCAKFDNIYLFQSKNPFYFSAIEVFLKPEQFRLCTTIETNRWYPEIMGHTEKSERRAEAMSTFKDRIKTYVTIEPIMEFDLDDMMRLMYICAPNQINIGADSGNNGLPEPSKENLEQLIFTLKSYYTIDKKINLKRLLT
jgi:DNA repair photolyase